MGLRDFIAEFLMGLRDFLIELFVGLRDFIAEGCVGFAQHIGKTINPAALPENSHAPKGDERYYNGSQAANDCDFKCVVHFPACCRFVARHYPSGPQALSTADCRRLALASCR